MGGVIEITFECTLFTKHPQADHTKNREVCCVTLTILDYINTNYINKPIEQDSNLNSLQLYLYELDEKFFLNIGGNLFRSSVYKL